MYDTSLSLICRLKGPVRDTAAWERFVHLYSPLLRFWSLKMGLREEESLDVVQETLLTLLDKLPEFEHDGRTFRGWLRTVLQNKCRDYMRRRNQEPETGTNLAPEECQPDVAELFREEEYRHYVMRQALKLMQQEFQETTWRAYWLTVTEALTAREVAQQLGISENAVFVARSRVLGRLREELRGLLD